MTEHDPAVMNVEEWADYWHSAKADIVFVSVTGILAFYPSKVKFHRHGKFLNDRDLFGECVAAAKKRGMRVVARMSPDLNWGDALEAHPEWAMRHKDGSVQYSSEEPRLFKTCMFSSYMDDYVPAIMREVNSLYDVDCFYTNGWPPLGSLPDCHCSICSKLPAAGTPAYWRVFNDRVFELWKIRRHRQREKARQLLLRQPRRQRPRRPESRSPRQIRRLVPGATTRAAATTIPPSGDAVCRAASATPCSTASSPPTSPPHTPPAVRWRNVSKNPAEAKMWLNETLASGMVPYYHFVGAENGFGEDRRWQKVGADYFRWTAKHDAHLTDAPLHRQHRRRDRPEHAASLSRPSSARSRAYMHETTQGIYDALLQGRFAFDFVHEDRLEPEQPQQISRAAAAQCRHAQRPPVPAAPRLRAVRRIAHGQLRNQPLRREPEASARTSVSPICSASARRAMSSAPTAMPTRRASKRRHVQPHPILDGFTNTNWLAGAQNRVPLKPVDESAAHRRSRLRALSSGARLPAGLAHRRARCRSARIRSKPHGLFPGRHRAHLLAHRPRRSAAAAAQHHSLGHPRRAHRSRRGRGFIEMFCWETSPGYAVHLLNYTNPNAHHGWLQSDLPARRRRR